MCKTQIPSTQSSGASVSPSSSATTNSSSLYNDVCSLSPNASSEDLTAPNSRIPPPVAHNTSSLDPFNANTGSSLGEANPISAPPADGDEVWYCCSCTTGPYLVALYPACTACNHSRCYYCKIDG